MKRWLWKSARGFRASRRPDQVRLAQACSFVAASCECELLEGRRLLAASLSLSGAQFPTPGATINVSSDGTFPQSEMLIVINPTNPLNVVGFGHRLTSPITLDVYRSTDGGTTWSTSQIDNADDGLGTVGNRFDPAVAFDANGLLYIVYGYRGSAVAPLRNSLLVAATSTDGGQTFGNFRTIDSQADIVTASTTDNDLPGVDRWTIATGTVAATTTQSAVVAYTQNVTEGSSNDQRIVVVGTQNGGANWTAPLIINDASINGTDGGNLAASPTIGLGGELSVAWYDGGTSILFDSDRNGLFTAGFDFGADRTVRTAVGLVDLDPPSAPPAQPERGISVSPVLASNIFNGHLYITFQERFAATTGNDTDIWFGRSTDFGQSWNWVTVENSTGTDFHPMMAVDRQSNAIGIAYYTTDGDQTSGNDDVRMRIALSADFGNTWSRADVSAQTSNEAGGYGGDYLEYTGLHLRDGTAHVLWASRYATGGTDLDAFTARVSFDSSTNGNVLRIVGSGPAPSNNDFVIRRSTTNADYIEVITDGVRDYTGLLDSINSIQIESGGIDSYTLENLPPIPVRIVGSTGADTISINRVTGASLLTIDLGNGDDVVGLGTGPFDVGTVASPVVFNGGDGNDTLYLGNGNADAITANVTFNGEGTPGGLGNRVVYNDHGVQYQVQYDVAPGVITRRGFFSPRTVTYSGTGRIIINGGADSDLITVRNGVSPVIEAYGNGGDDIFTRGVVNPGGGAIFNGGAGTNTITFDGTAENVGRLWDIYPDRVIFGGIFNYLTTGFQSVSVLAGGGDDTVTFFAGSVTYSQAITADGGGGSDTFTSTGARIPSLTVRGGDGFDYLRIDDRTTAANLDSYALHPSQYTRYQFDPGGGPSFTAFYGGFESMTAWRTSDQAFVEVFGTSPDIASTHSTWLVGNTTDSVISVYPRDAQGNLSIHSNLTLSGGGTAASDQVIINNSGGSLPISYRLFNQFGNSTAYVGGMGTGWVGVETDFDSLTFHAGGGDDVFNIDGYRSPSALALNGGNGDDTVHWTPTSKDLGNIGSQTSFNFDGGDGHDEMRFHNDNSTSAYTYYPFGSTLAALRHSTGTGVGSITAANLELMYVSGTPQADGFNIWGASAGTVLELAGRGGSDVYGLGGIFPTNAQTIRSLVRIDGSGGGDDTIAIYGTEDSVGRTVHLTQDTIGAYPGDNLFGPGGSVQFSAITGNIQLNLGSGADTVYARPNTSATVTIHGNNPTSAPGDQLNLAVANAGSYSLSGTPASGAITSSNLRTLNWTGFETGPTVDEIAPAVLVADININGIDPFAEGVQRRQSIDVQFSEDVSALISPAWLELTNLTTNQTIPTSNVAVEYDSVTNTAHFTFPGYTHSVLPDGNYQGRVLAGLPDFFGNPLPADAPFSFFFLNGDANRDGRVNLSDFNILAANFGQSGRSFGQGDFTYDGLVNLSDFNILAGRFGIVLGASASGRGAGAFSPTQLSPLLPDDAQEWDVRL